MSLSNEYLYVWIYISIYGVYINIYMCNKNGEQVEEDKAIFMVRLMCMDIHVFMVFTWINISLWSEVFVYGYICVNIAFIWKYMCGKYGEQGEEDKAIFMVTAICFVYGYISNYGVYMDRNMCDEYGE